MKSQIVSHACHFEGSPRIPGDKSISHRSLILGALASGTTKITGLLKSGDILSTEHCLKALGVEIIHTGETTTVVGKGSKKFHAPTDQLDCGNSGTTLRLLTGLIAGTEITATLTGDESLIRRPMKRIVEPLSLMGAKITLSNGDYAPVTISGQKLHAITYPLRIASAQLKSALLLAALSADGTTHLTGKIQSRDHTERLLIHFGGNLEQRLDSISIKGRQILQGTSVDVPGDPSAAAFWMAAACMIPSSKLQVKNISLNPTRTGFIRALIRMGANVRLETTSQIPEPSGEITTSAGDLKGVYIGPDEIPALIDELPLIAVLATQAHGLTEVQGAEELRVKESDRLLAIATNLRAMGAEIQLRDDGFLIEGPQKLIGAEIQSFHDHRIAMAFSIAALVASGDTKIFDADCVGISYPDFYATLKELTTG